MRNDLPKCLDTLKTCEVAFPNVSILRNCLDPQASMERILTPRRTASEESAGRVAPRGRTGAASDKPFAIVLPLPNVGYTEGRYGQQQQRQNQQKLPGGMTVPSASDRVMPSYRQDRPAAPSMLRSPRIPAAPPKLKSPQVLHHSVPSPELLSQEKHSQRSPQILQQTISVQQQQQEQQQEQRARIRESVFDV